eukprot:m.89998 g.89998  ORF g.89998 m.89998 type:complete len:160 (+) comp36637_c0_seq1:998-1477(+)
MSDCISLTHQEAKKKFQSDLADILGVDPHLGDIPKDVTLDEAKGFLALAMGHSITVTLCKYDGEEIQIVVPRAATVRVLKKAIKRTLTLRAARSGDTKRVSWKCVWKSYWLYFDNQKLTNDHASILHYGIQNQDKIGFVKRLRKEDKAKRPRQKHQKQY